LIEAESVKPEKALLISPNLGHPLFLDIDRKFKQEEFEVNLLFVSNIKNTDNFEMFIKHRLSFIPILEYKWKLKAYFEKEKERRLERKKKRSIWDKIKSIFSRKTKKKEEELPPILELTDSTGKKFDIVQAERIESLRPQAFRGALIKGILLKVEPVKTCEIDKVKFDSYYSPRNYLIKYNIYSGLNEFYKATIRFSLSKEVLEFLERFNFVMFDLWQEMPNKEVRVSYHSFVVSKNKWSDFKFFHATDLHLAERNDRIYEIVKKWNASVRESDLGELLVKGAKAVSFFQRLLIKKPEDKIPIKTTEPLRKRFINPNNNFRKFIKLINKKVNKNDLDFVVLTGDLIDFVILSKIPTEKRKSIEFNYKDSNWRIFKEILLNFPQEKRRGMVSGEEILCPIFTIPGNHDYRPFHYDLRWGNLYRKIGLLQNEVIALNNELLANPISSITKSFSALKAYLIEFNSSLDYFLKLGNNNFIFLNTGSDSFKKLMDFLSGHPSVTGISEKHIKYLENIINHKIEPENNTYLMLHGPPINPKKKISSLKRYAMSKPSKELITKIGEFKESLIQKLGKNLSLARIDDKFDVQYGAISTNWEKLLKFCLDFCILTLAGHTHQLKEFRLTDPQDLESKVVNTHTTPFELKKIDNPAAIYYDIYSELYNNPEDIENNAPFVVQTPALGFGSYKNPQSASAFREIVIKKGKLASFKVKYLNR
jgi:Icc-related predicted phosphoesterase